VNAPDAFAAAAEEHRRAIDTCSAALRAVAESDWNAAREAKKWSPAQIAEHLAIVYDPVLSELEGGPGLRPLVPWWKWKIIRWKFLPRILAGTFLPGVPAPREVRPVATSGSPEDGARKLSERAAVFLNRFALARSGGRAAGFTHPYLGRLTDVDALRFLTSHAHHHRRQLP
jgi:hypothetical protein